MLHNGYPIRPDMLDSSGSRASLVGENLADGAKSGSSDYEKPGYKQLIFLFYYLLDSVWEHLLKWVMKYFDLWDLLTKIVDLRSFSLDKLHYWRESASGMTSLAYFLAKDIVDHINTIVKRAVYLSVFYFFSNPRSSILDNNVALLCVLYCVTRIAYALSIYIEPGQA
ncbi:hypothetical protein CQW23_28311 [Capsicum baccatum]|uniref:ABC transporter family G domain-containing protein n=1 Tax=Capsicum baccatum TaxID=33114 RepID=A0A2G2VG66_CAPBA|nr:hypothetical protein CQW23_28311 [Capsicum baccatum]